MDLATFSNTKLRKLVFPAIAVMSAVSLVSLHMQVDQLVSDTQYDRNAFELPKYEVLRLCTLGFDQLFSDVYWLLFVQYCGERQFGRGDVHRRTYDYVNLITELDPRFEKPYWFGCWAIGYWQKRPDLADKVLQRGMKYNPNDWYLPFLAGCNQYIFGKDSKAGAVYFRKAASIKGAPPFLTRQAAILESPMPEIIKRLHTIAQLYDNAKDPEAKEAYRKELVRMYMDMYKTAVTQPIKDRAKHGLKELGEDVSKL